jgi:3-methylfumaryl-CoA hydratase
MHGYHRSEKGAGDLVDARGLMSMSGTTVDTTFQDLRRWVGKTVTAEDRVTGNPARALAATLDRDLRLETGDPLPPPWHWLYFLTMEPLSDAGPDGHPKRGGFLPPVPLPRRMWAGSRMEFLRPLRVGDAIRRESRIVDVKVKEGRSGTLVFVTVRHEITSGSERLLTDEHDIVYRDLQKAEVNAPAPRMAPSDHGWMREIAPTPVLLFRYSALTFNSHRIHYDFPYVTGIEGYPGLVVHGPLLATLLLDLLLRQMPRARVTRFEFRAVSPLFDNARFAVCGRPDADGGKVALWAKADDGRLAMEAAATIA